MQVSIRSLALMIMLVATSCGLGGAREQPAPATSPAAEVLSLDESVDLESLLGQRVTVEGEAVNWKTGAQVRGRRTALWVDGLREWPDGYWRGEGRSRRVRVTGTIIRRYDLPVFRMSHYRDHPEMMPGGIPVGDDVDLHEAAKRYLLEGAVWRSVMGR